MFWVLDVILHLSCHPYLLLSQMLWIDRAYLRLQSLNEPASATDRVYLPVHLIIYFYRSPAVILTDF